MKPQTALSEYHAVLISVVAFSLIPLGGRFWASMVETLVSADTVIYGIISFVSLVYAFVIGVKRGSKTRAQKTFVIVGLVYLQVTIGLMLGFDGFQSESLFAKLLGACMLIVAVVRLVGFFVDIMVELQTRNFSGNGFSDLDLGSVGIVTMFVVAALLIASAKLFVIDDFIILGFAFLIADLFTMVREPTALRTQQSNHETRQ